MANIIHAFSTAFKPAIPLISAFSTEAIQKLRPLVKHAFNFIQWGFVTLYGAKEILFDRVTDLQKTKKENSSHQSEPGGSIFKQNFFKKAPLAGAIKFHHAHGSLYMASGVSGSLAAAHHLGWLNLGSQVAFSLEIAGNGLFGIASLIALIQNIKIYRAASKVCESAPLHEKEAANKLKTSSMMGILSNLNYIIGAALLMIGSLATLALLFGCIAVFIGGLKILYDFLQFRNAY